MNKAISRVAVLLCLSSLIACSGTTFVYNRLDTILPWYVDDYVDLNGRQQDQLDEILEPFLRWHRQQELPQYVALLNEVDTTLDRPVTPERVSHEDFKAANARAVAVVRTGEATPYANVALYAGVTF